MTTARGRAAQATVPGNGGMGLAPREAMKEPKFAEGVEPGLLGRVRRGAPAPVWQRGPGHCAKRAKRAQFSNLIGVSALLLACSGSVSPDTGAGGEASAAGGAQSETPVAQGDRQIASSSGLVCPVSAEDVCATMPPTPFGYESCVANWSDVADDGRACVLISDVARECVGYQVREITNADVGTYYYYDQASGKLVAVVGLRNPGVYKCLGGPSQFVMPKESDCGSSEFVPTSCGGAGGT